MLLWVCVSQTTRRFSETSASTSKRPSGVNLSGHIFPLILENSATTTPDWADLGGFSSVSVAPVFMFLNVTLSEVTVPYVLRQGTTARLSSTSHFRERDCVPFVAFQMRKLQSKWFVSTVSESSPKTTLRTHAGLGSSGSGTSFSRFAFTCFIWSRNDTTNSGERGNVDLGGPIVDIALKDSVFHKITEAPWHKATTPLLGWAAKHVIPNLKSSECSSFVDFRFHTNTLPLSATITFAPSLLNATPGVI